jgi:hypothetical protein
MSVEIFGKTYIFNETTNLTNREIQSIKKTVFIILNYKSYQYHILP